MLSQDSKTHISCAYSDKDIVNGWLKVESPYYYNYYTNTWDSLKIDPDKTWVYDTLLGEYGPGWHNEVFTIIAQFDTVQKVLNGPVFYISGLDTLLRGMHRNGMADGDYSFTVGGDTTIGIIKNGLAEGFFIDHKEDNIHFVTQFKNGERNGIQYFYDSNGINLVKTYKDGLSDGLEVDFHANGRLHCYLYRKKEGYEDGEYPFYDEKGEIYQILRVVKGKQKLIRVPQN